MNPLRKWIRDLFGFSGTEINGFLILIPLMVLLIFSESFYRGWMSRGQRHYPGDARRLDSVLLTWNKPLNTHKESAVIQRVGVFAFDPNTASAEELQQLGFSARSANRIAAYRRKGGVFRIKSDLLKIYGLDSALYNQLYAFIKLPSSRSTGDQRPGSAPRERVAKERVKKTFDINTADTILLKTVYGIGPTLAARIVRFRDALGGFVEPGQLKEVYGLEEAVAERLLEVSFIDPEFVPEKVNINTDDERILSGHPYIRRKIAGALISYRFQHGDFMEVSDIKNLSIMQPDEVERLLPYITIDE